MAYGVDVETAREVLIKSLESVEWVMKEGPVEALMLSISDCALLFRVRCRIEDYMDTRRVIDRMSTRLNQALSVAKIEMVMPQRQVFLEEPAVTKMAQIGASEL